ncbi:MAG: DUF6446 family protein [Pseudooceanicola sp.]
MGKVLATVILVAALVAGVSLYYLQVYAFYDRLEATGPGDVLLVPADGTAPEPLPHEAFQAIDSDSSPIRYRACFILTEEFDPSAWTPYPDAEPRNAPGWFECFDSTVIGEALADGSARAFLSVPEVQYGIDRVVAVLPDGRGFAWHEINECGEVVFDGRPTPEGCPTPPPGTARQ